MLFVVYSQWQKYPENTQNLNYILSFMLIQTSSQYDLAVSHCREIFVNKMKDYGSAWRILRVSSITDQVYIKAQRIRSIETHGTQKVDEGIRSEYIGIVNYAMIALIQLELQGKDTETELPLKKGLW